MHLDFAEMHKVAIAAGSRRNGTKSLEVELSPVTKTRGTGGRQPGRNCRSMLGERGCGKIRREEMDRRKEEEEEEEEGFKAKSDEGGDGGRNQGP